MVIKTTIYLHSEKENMYEMGKVLKLTKKQMNNFIYTGYEIDLDIEIDDTGQAWATHVNKIKLKRKVKI